MQFKKIINDPVYGFITVDDELIFNIIAHPYYQRLRPLPKWQWLILFIRVPYIQGYTIL